MIGSSERKSSAVYLSELGPHVEREKYIDALMIRDFNKVATAAFLLGIVIGAVISVLILGLSDHLI